LGKRETSGSTEIENESVWEGKKDPLFTLGMEEIETMLNKDINSWSNDYRAIFRLQMAYTFLWTIIERYTALRYSLKENPSKRIVRIAQETSFVESLKRNVEIIDEEQREIFRTDNPKEKEVLDPDNPKKAINYYYQVRSNIVHRGKYVVRDHAHVLLSLKELLAIFKDVLNEAFGH